MSLCKVRPDKPDAVVSSRIAAMKEVLYKRELLTQVAQEFHLYGYEKEARRLHSTML